MLAVGSSASAQNYGALQRSGRCPGARRRRGGKAARDCSADRRQHGARPVVRSDERGRHAERRGPADAAGAVGDRLAEPVDRDRSRVALSRRLAALRFGRPIQRRRSARRAGQLPRHCGLFRSARRIGRRPARGRPGGHEPRRVGQISAGLVRRRQAAGAILVRPARSVPVRSTPARPRGRRARASPGWRWRMSSRASAATCCGTTPIMSLRRGVTA